MTKRMATSKTTLEKRIHLPPKATSVTHFAVVIAEVIAEVKIQTITKQEQHTYGEIRTILLTIQA